MSALIRKLVLILFILLITPALFAAGEREKTKSEIRDLIKAGDFSAAMQVILDRYEDSGNKEEFDLWFIRESGDIIKIEREYTKLVNNFTRILNKGQENISETDLEELYEIIVRMTELKPIPPEEAKNFITQARRIAGGIANGKKLSRLMNEAIVLLDSADYQGAMQMYIGGFSLNRDVFDESGFSDEIIGNIDDALSVLRQLEVRLPETRSRLEERDTAFRNGQAALDADGLTPTLQSLLGALDAVADIRIHAYSEGRKINAIEDVIINEFGTDKDIYYFRFLDFLINGRNDETKAADGIDLSATEGIEAVFSRLWLAHGEPLLALIKSRIQYRLAGADTLFDARDYPTALVQYEEAAKMAGHILKIMESWQRYLFADQDEMVADTADRLVYDGPDEGFVLANMLYARSVADLSGLQKQISNEYLLYDKIRERGVETSGRANLLTQRSLLLSALNTASGLENAWTVRKQQLTGENDGGYQFAEALAIINSGLSRISGLVSANHGHEDFLAAKIFDLEMEPLLVHYAQVIEGITAAEGVRSEFTKEEVPDLAGGFVYVDYAFASEQKYLTVLNSADSLLNDLAVLKETKSEEIEYIQTGSNFIQARARFTQLENNATAARQNILSSLQGIDFERAEGLSTALAEKIRYDFETQKEILARARAALEDPAEQQLRTIENTGERELQAAYPQTSSDLIDSIASKLKGINTHVQAMNDYMQETMAAYRSSPIVENNLRLVETVNNEVNSYTANLDGTRQDIERIFARNSAQVRYDAVRNAYTKFSQDFEKALGLGNTISDYTNDTLENTDAIVVRYAADSDRIASSVLVGMQKLLTETEFILGVFDNEADYVIGDADFQNTVRKTKTLQNSLRSGINEAQAFLYTQRRQLADSSAVARADYIEKRMNEFESRMKNDAGTTGVVSTRSVAQEGVPDVNVEYNFNSLQIYRDSLDGLADLDRQGSIIINDINSSPYTEDSQVLREQADRIAALQERIAGIREESRNFEYTLERDFKIRYSEALYATLESGFTELEQLYSDADQGMDGRTEKRRSVFDGDRTLTVSADYSAYSAEKVETVRQKIEPLILQMKNSLDLLKSPEFTEYSNGNDAIAGSTDQVADIAEAAADLKAKAAAMAGKIENDYISKIYTARQEILAARITELQNTYARAEQLLNGEEAEERVGNQAISVLKKYPEQIQQLVIKTPADMDLIQADINALNRSLGALPQEQKRDERISTLTSGFSTQSTEVQNLRRRIEEIRNNAYTQNEKAAGYKLQGDRYFNAAKKEMNSENYSSVRKNLDQAAINYQNSLDLKWDREIFNRQQIEIITMKQDLVDRQKALVEREISDLLVRTNSAYRIGDYQEARKSLNSAENRWEEVFYDITNDEISFWNDLIQNAMRTSTGRVVSKNDAQYDTISNLLDQARQDYISGQDLYKADRKRDGLKYFDAARDKIDAVLNLFPINKEANVLALKIEKIINPGTWNDYLKKEFNAAVAVSLTDPVAALSRFEDIRELDPAYPGLDSQIEKMEYATGKRVRTDENKRTQAVIEYQKAKKIYDGGNVGQFNTALNYINNSIKLNPVNDDALYLRNLIYEKMAQYGVKSTSGYTITQLSIEDRRTLNDITILFSSGRDTDIRKAWIMFEELEKKGDNRNNPDVKRLGVEIRKALGI